jgi:hypothetical protein
MLVTQVETSLATPWCACCAVHAELFPLYDGHAVAWHAFSQSTGTIIPQTACTLRALSIPWDKVCAH